MFIKNFVNPFGILFKSIIGLLFQKCDWCIVANYCVNTPSDVFISVISQFCSTILPK